MKKIDIYLRVDTIQCPRFSRMKIHSTIPIRFFSSSPVPWLRKVGSERGLSSVLLVFTIDTLKEAFPLAHLTHLLVYLGQQQQHQQYVCNVCSIENPVKTHKLCRIDD